MLLDAPSLQLDFPALALAYLSVFNVNGRALTTALAKFPEVTYELRSVRLRWRARRLIVKAAEESCHSNGRHFRGRQHPIYAKDLRSAANVEMLRMVVKDAKRGVKDEAKQPEGRGLMNEFAVADLNSPVLVTSDVTPGGVWDCGANMTSTPTKGTPGPASRGASPNVHTGASAASRSSGKEARRSQRTAETEVQYAASEYGLEIRRMQMAKAGGDGDGGGGGGGGSSWGSAWRGA